MPRRHGHTADGGTPEYHVWRAMRQRCTNQRAANYKWYGALGIRVCVRWDAFENFLADMGVRPSRQHSIERRDRQGNYEPDNCYWATWVEQNHNRCDNVYLEHAGKRLIVADWAPLVGVLQKTIHGRLSRGWSVADALTKPLRTRKGRADWDVHSSTEPTT